MTLEVKKDDSRSQVVGVSVPYAFQINSNLDLNHGERERMDFEVVNKWYTESGDVQRVFLEYHGTGKGDITQLGGGEKNRQKEDEKEKGAEKPLSEIAEEKLKGEEFEITGKESSSISEAKREAMEQQRDPAIDPKINNINSTDEDN